MSYLIEKTLNFIKGTSNTKFVFVFGDEGVILLHTKNNKLVNRLFSATTEFGKEHPFDKVINQDSRAEISVILETTDQSYTMQTLPAVSILSINKLVQRYIIKNFSSSELAGAIFIDREKTGRKDWRYMFVSATILPKLESILKYISAKPNLFLGCTFLPVESQKLIDKLFNYSVNKQEQYKTQLCVFYTKTGGLRQIVMHDKKVIFTRLISQKYADSPDVVAGTISQEIDNTIEYLSRLSSDYNKNINILIIVSADIKDKFSQALDLKENYTLNIFSPYEAAKYLKLENFVSEQDKYADIMFAAGIAQELFKTLIVNTQHNDKVKKIYFTAQSVKTLGLTICSCLTLLTVISVYELWSNYRDVTFSEDNLSKIKLKLIHENEQEEKKYQELEGIKAEDIHLIQDTVLLYKTLTNDKKFDNPLEVLSKFAKLKNDSIFVKSFNWDSTERSNRNRYNTSEEGDNKVLEVNLNIDFVNKGSNFEQLFKDFDNFNNNLKDNFKEYDVKVSRLPEKITFTDKNRIIPIQVSLITPKS